jgi:hypothetical protein
MIKQLWDKRGLAWVGMTLGALPGKQMGDGQVLIALCGYHAQWASSLTMLCSKTMHLEFVIRHFFVVLFCPGWP